MAFTTVLDTEPEKITAGDSVSWKKSYSDYLASDSWVLSYALVADGEQITITGSADGDDHLVELAAATTAAYTAETYSWQSYVTKGSERYQVDSGTMEVEPNFAAQSSGYDNRSNVKKILDALEAVLENRATVDQQSYSIAGRQISKMIPSDLISWHSYFRSRYVAEQQKERIRRGKASGALIKARVSN